MLNAFSIGFVFMPFEKNRLINLDKFQFLEYNYYNYYNAKLGYYNIINIMWYCSKMEV